MNSWKGQFKDYTTNLAFRLSLSKEMVYTMELIRDSYHNGGWYTGKENFGRFVPAVRCLISRGLVTHHAKPNDYSTWTREQQMAFDETHRFYVITEAGWAVVRLLELAELIKPAQVKEGTNG